MDCTIECSVSEVQCFLTMILCLTLWLNSYASIVYRSTCLAVFNRCSWLFNVLLACTAVILAIQLWHCNNPNATPFDGEFLLFNKKHQFGL